MCSSNGNCGDEYCSDCVPDGDWWKNCQYCDAIYCDDCSDVMNVCNGEGCERANCNHGLCIDNNEGRPECVIYCDSLHEDGCFREFCLECRVKECKDCGSNSCNICLTTIAPHLGKENNRLLKMLLK